MNTLHTYPAAADGLRSRIVRPTAVVARVGEPSSGGWPCLQVTAGTSRFWVHDAGAGLDDIDGNALQGRLSFLQAAPSHYQDRKVVFAARCSPLKMEYAFYQLDGNGRVVEEQRECFNAAAAVAHCYASGAAPASVLNRRTGQLLSVQRLSPQDSGLAGSSQWRLTRCYDAAESLAHFAPARVMAHRLAGEVQVSFYEQGNHFMLLDLGCCRPGLLDELTPGSIASLAERAVFLFVQPGGSAIDHFKIIVFARPESEASQLLSARFFSGCEAHRSIPASGAMLLYRHAVERLGMTAASLHLDGLAGGSTVHGEFTDLGGRRQVSKTSFLSQCGGPLWRDSIGDAAEEEWAR